METYLSIDLDYWLTNLYEYNESKSEKIIKIIYKFIDNLPNTNSKHLVDNHQDILPFLEKLDYDTIIHMDYHQDIVYENREDYPLKVSCGNFFYFLSKRKDVNFKWFCPTPKCWKKPYYYGLCDDYPMNKKNWIFKSQTVKTGIPNLLNVDIVGIGISISKEYCNCSIDSLYKMCNRIIEVNKFEYTGKEIQFMPEMIQFQKIMEEA